MFDNFIYFIIVLLIYTTYQPAENPGFKAPESIFIFILLALFFTWLTKMQFKRIEKSMEKGDFSLLDHRFGKVISRQSVMAIALFALDIYGLNLTELVSGIKIFSLFPTLQALFFICVFIFYLSIIWYLAHDLYRKIYSSRMSRKSYIISSISFSIPILLPWLIISGLYDIINLMPFEAIKKLLMTTQGQAVFFLTFLFFVAMIGPLLIQKFWGCTPLETGYQRERIADLCKRADLEYKDILYWPIFEGRMITAGVMGLVKRFRYILVTKSLLTLLHPEEIEAVIAHEIGHVKRRHLLFYLFFFVGYMLLSYATFDLVIWFIIYTEPLYRFVISSGFSQATVTSTLVTTITLFIFLIYFRYIFGYFMRNFERQADCYVYSLFDSARPLISTFEKIILTSGQSPDKPNWHHFSIKERVEYLLKCEHDRIWIKRHDKKIQKSIAVYVAGMVVVGFMGYSLNFGETGKKLSENFFEKVILREIEKNPHDPELHTLLGDLYYEKKDWQKTIEAYDKAIILDPKNIHALNNLAWLFATCENKKFRNPGAALELAKEAANLSDKPHILDTLGESYFVNGYFKEAVAIEKKALEKVKDGRSHYVKQLARFKKALENQETGSN